MLPTRFVLENRSGGQVWHGGSDGCHDDWLSTRPASPAPAEPMEVAALTAIHAELHCVCDCADLAQNEQCTTAACPPIGSCTAAFWSSPVAPDGTLVSEVLLATTQLDARRNCLKKVGYPAGTEFIAEFCWSASESARAAGERTCEERHFSYGDPVVALAAEE